MIRELDTVVLSRDIEEYGLKQGDIGAVVHCYQNSVAFEVEFVTGEGETIAVLTLLPEDIRAIQGKEYCMCGNWPLCRQVTAITR